MYLHARVRIDCYAENKFEGLFLEDECGDKECSNVNKMTECNNMKQNSFPGTVWNFIITECTAQFYLSKPKQNYNLG